MQLCASVAKLRSSGAHSSARHDNHGGIVEQPLPRIILGNLQLIGPQRQNSVFSFSPVPVHKQTTASHAAWWSLMPSGTTPVSTYRQSAMMSLRASATMKGFREPWAFSVRFLYHCTRSLSGWNINIRHDN